MAIIPGQHFDDDSEFQHQAWQQYAKNRSVGIIRVDYGVYHIDQQWAQNHPARVSSGLLKACGLYQYLVAGQDPTAQANAFCDMVGTLDKHEFVICDAEEGDGDQTPRLLAWFDVVDRRLGRRGARRLRWFAAYGQAPDLHDDFWQHTDGEYGNHECQPAYPGGPVGDCSVSPLDVPSFLSLIEECNTVVYSYVPFIRAHINLDALDLPHAGNPTPTPSPQPQGTVMPKWSPAVVVPPVVADLACPTGGAWTLSQDGSLDAWGGAPAIRGVNGEAFFAGRTVATLCHPNETPTGAHPPTGDEAAAGNLVVVIATSGERYARGPKSV